MAYYLDTSALAKLVVGEPETDRLRQWLRAHPRQPVASELARVELLRATRRTDPERMLAARMVLDSITLLALDIDVLELAAKLDPVGLRSLDAIHLASAVSLLDDLEGIVTYDLRLGEAALGYGVRVLAPGS